MSHKPLTSENRTRLMGLVDKIADHVAGGLTPTDALVKAATDGEYPLEYVRRAAEAYNGAAHLQHFKSAGVDARGDSFPLCDADKAVEIIGKSAESRSKAASVSCTAWDMETQPLFLIREPEPVVKAAKDAKTTQVDDVSELIKMAADVDRQERLSIRILDDCYQDASLGLGRDLYDFRCKTAAISEHRRIEWVRELTEKRGAQHLPFLALAANVSAEECQKEASRHVGYYSLGQADMTRLEQLLDRHLHTTEVHEKLAKAEMDFFVNRLVRRNELDSLLGVTKISFGFDTVVDAISPGDKTKSRDDSSAKALNTLLDPGYISQIKNIDQAMSLKGMLHSDPVISKRHPQEVQEALNDISTVAPTASLYPPMLRAMLRKRLEMGHQVSDLDLNQMLNMEKSVRENEVINLVPKVQSPEGNGRKDDGNG